MKPPPLPRSVVFVSTLPSLAVVSPNNAIVGARTRLADPDDLDMPPDPPERDAHGLSIERMLVARSVVATTKDGVSAGAE